MNILGLADEYHSSLERRNAPEFSTYFNQVWKVLQDAGDSKAKKPVLTIFLHDCQNRLLVIFNSFILLRQPSRLLLILLLRRR